MAGDVLTTLIVELGADFAKLTAGVKGAVNEVKKASSEMQSVWGKKSPKAIKQTQDAMENFHQHTRKAVKDISRVVTGILISQTFYKLLRTIREATRSVIDFAINMEKAAVAFTRLLGSEERAKAFLSALEDLASVTPIQIEPLRDGAQQLLAMQFAAKDVIPILRVLTDTISATGGGNENLLQATRVLGKIKAVGKLQARELRSLATLNIPIYEILQEELELTKKEISNIGNLKIPAEQAVQAILQGMDKRFKGLAKMMSRTLGGLISTIKDNLLFIGRDISAGLFESFKEQASEFLDFLQELRQATKANGLKGLLHALFPPEMVMIIEMFGSSLGKLGQAMGKLFQAARPLIDALSVSFLSGLTLVIEALAFFIDKLAVLIEFVMRSKTAVIILSVAIAKLVISATVATAVSALAKAIKGLGIASAVAGAVTKLAMAFKALAIYVAANPIVIGIGAIIVALGYLITRIKAVSIWIDNLKKKFAEFFGFATQLTVGGEVIEDFSDWENAIIDLGDGAENAGEQFKKFLAPFDELIRLPDDIGGALGGIGDAFDIPEINVEGGEGQIETSGMIGKFQEFQNWLDEHPIVFPEVHWPDSIFPVFAEVLELVYEFWLNMQAAFNLGMQGVVDAIFAGNELLTNPMNDFLDRLTEGLSITEPLNAFDLAWDTIQETTGLGLAGVYDQIMDALPTIADALSLKDPITSFKDAWSTLMEEAELGGEGVLEEVESFISDFAIAMLVPMPIANFVTAWEELSEKAKTGGQNVIKEVQAFVKDLSFEFEIPDPISTFEQSWQTLKNKTQTGIDNVMTVVDSLINDMNLAFQLAQPIITYATSWDTIKSKTQTGIDNVMAVVDTWIINLGEKFKLPDPIQVIEDSWETIKETVQTGFDDVMTVVDTWITDLGTEFLLPGPVKAINDTWDVIRGDTKSFLSGADNSLKKFWENHALDVALIIAGIGVAIGIFLFGLPASLAAGFAAVVLAFKTKIFDKIEQYFKDSLDSWRHSMAEKKEGLVASAKNLWSSIKEAFQPITQVVKVVKDTVSGSGGSTQANSGSSRYTDILNTPGTKAANIPGLANGGIVSKDQVIRVGEGNKKEGVVPLEDSVAMQPFARAIAAEMGADGGGGRPVMYVGSLIVDDTDLRKLTKRIDIIRSQENDRRDI